MTINNSKIMKNRIKKVLFYQLIIVMLAGFLVPFNSVRAVDTTPLVISNISITKTDKTATITWLTNRPTVGKIEYGLYSKDYRWTLDTNDKKTEHAMTISGLFPETDYFFKITASDNISEVTSFEQTFKTNKAGDNKTPIITDVRVPYLTGNTATIQWYTDEEATSEVDYGLTTNYGSHFSDGNRVKIHDITITGLIDGTQYHFSVKSKDKDNNTAKWYDLTFRTKLTNKTDRDELTIYNVTPASENDINVTETSAVISWQTNKLARGWVRYGGSTSYGKTVATNPPRDFTQLITLTGLKPGTVYYFEIQAKDVLNKEIKSSGYSFKTKSTVPNNNYPDAPGQILGTSSCDVNLNTEFGYYGLYYNLTKDHPDVETWKNNVATAADNDWYNSQYFSFSRVDPDLEFGKNFFPLDENKPGDPYGFAVHWRAMIKADQDGFYHYKITSDDDSWVFIDGRLTSDLHGIHEAKTDNQDIGLSAGYHTLEIYFAERQSRGSDMLFTPDPNLKVYPLPEGCTIQDVLDFNNLLGGDVGGGYILGDSTDSDYQTAPRAEDMMKIAATPATTAILTTTAIKTAIKTATTKPQARTPATRILAIPKLKLCIKQTTVPTSGPFWQPARSTISPAPNLLTYISAIGIRLKRFPGQL